MRGGRVLLVSLLALTLAACQTKPEASSDQVANLDQPVVLEAGVNYLDLSEADKARAYERLDRIKRDSSSQKKMASYSQVIAINSDQDYDNFLRQTDQQPDILYLGFDECPYCQAFIPKLNQLAKELGLSIYYYDVVELEGSQSYQDIAQRFAVKTVPHAFVVEEGQVEAKLDHQSTLAQMEDVLRQLPLSYQEESE